MVTDTSMGAAGQEWRWTLTSGCVTLLLAVIAAFLPDIHLAPRGGLVGWILCLAGLVELAFGWRRGLDPVGKAAAGSGLFTTLAGLMFVANPRASYFPVANLVMVWLFLRGAWVLAMALQARRKPLAPWLGLTGVTDVLLGFALLAGLPVTVLTYLLFGPVPEIVARFALILAVSFLVTAISQIAIALAERRRRSIASA
jgi:uncharacterized membrane protein HdeD (DUF308 family)